MLRENIVLMCCCMGAIVTQIALKTGVFYGMITVISRTSAKWRTDNAYIGLDRKK